MASRADVLLAENERLNAQRLQLLRDLRSHAQTLGSKSVLHYGLSAAQCRALNDFAARLRKAGPRGEYTGIVSPTGRGGDVGYPGLKKQLRQQAAAATALRKELKVARKERAEAQRLLQSGRWGTPGYLRNSFDNGVSGWGQSLLEETGGSKREGGAAAGRYGNGNISSSGVRRRERPGDGGDRDEELEILRVTCARLKEQLDLPDDFQYDDIGTYSRGELARAKAGLAEAERQNEILEAERLTTVTAHRDVQVENAALRKELNEVRDQISSLSSGDGNSSVNSDKHQLMQHAHALRASLSRAEVELRRLRAREDRANSILASNKRRDNELADCMTELLETRRCLEAREAELDRESQARPGSGGAGGGGDSPRGGSDEDARLGKSIEDLFDAIAEDIDNTSRVQASTLIEAILPDADGDENAEVKTCLDQHWALRILRLQLTVANSEDDVNDSTGVAASALLSLGKANRDGCLDIDDVKQFCLGPLLSLYFHKGGNGFAPGMGSNGPVGAGGGVSPQSDRRRRNAADSKQDDEVKNDDSAVVIAVPVSQPAKIKSAWGKEDTGAKLLATANETIRRQKRRIQKLESLRVGTGAVGAGASANPHRMVQLFEKKYVDERDRAAALRRRCQTLQDELCGVKKDVTSLSARLKASELARESEMKEGASSNDETATTTTSDDKINQESAVATTPKSKRILAEQMAAAEQEIECLRETTRRLLRKLGLDESFKFPDILIKDALRTRMDDMKDANEAIARASRDELWDARRKIAVLERQLAKESRRSARLAAVAKSTSSTSKDVRLTLALQKRVDIQAATIRKLAVQLQNAQGDYRKKAVQLQTTKALMEKLGKSAPAEDERQDHESTPVSTRISSKSKAKRDKATRKNKDRLVKEVGPEGDDASAKSRGRMMTAPGKPRDRAMEDMVASLQKENSKLKKRNLRLADSFTLLKLKHEAVSTAKATNKNNHKSGSSSSAGKKAKKKKKSARSSSGSSTTEASEGEVDDLESTLYNTSKEGSAQRVSAALRKRLAHLELENKRIVAANKVLQSRARVTTQMVARVHVNARRKFDIQLKSALEKSDADSRSRVWAEAVSAGDNNGGLSKSVDVGAMSTSGGASSLKSAPMLRVRPERPRSAGSATSTGRSKKGGVKRKGSSKRRKRRGLKTSSGDQGQQNNNAGAELLVLRSELHVLQRTKTELEAELTMTRTLCHELEAGSFERENKLVEVETVVRRALSAIEKAQYRKRPLESKSKDDDETNGAKGGDSDGSDSRFVSTDKSRLSPRPDETDSDEGEADEGENNGLDVDRILNRVLSHGKGRKRKTNNQRNNEGSSLPQHLLLLVQSQRQIEVLYRVLHEKQSEIHAFAANAGGASGGDATVRAETEYAVDEFHIEVDRLTRELARVRRHKDTEVDKLNRRLKKQIRSAEQTREAANRALESVLEVYPEALALITDGAAAPRRGGRGGGGTGRMGMSPPATASTSEASAPGKKKGSSPMSLILEQGGRVRRAKDASKHGRIDAENGLSPSSGSSLELDGDVLLWTPSQVGTWLANIVGLPHCVPRFLAEAVDGQLLLTLTDADLAGELGMSARGIAAIEGRDGGQQPLSPDEHEVERKKVVDGIKALKEKNKAFRRNKRSRKKKKEEERKKQAKAKKNESFTSSPTSLRSTEVDVGGPASPSHLKHRLSLIDSETDRIDLLIKEITTLHSHNTSIKEQHAILSKRLEQEREQSRNMRHKHEEERKQFEKKLLAEQKATLERQQEQMEREKRELEQQQQQQQPLPEADLEAKKAAEEAAKKAAEAKEKRKRLKAMFAVNEIPSFHTVRPPQGKVIKHVPRDSKAVDMAAVKGVLKKPSYSAGTEKHASPKRENATRRLVFKPPEQNSLAVIERVPEEQNEELWWTMDDLDRSSAEADMESMVEELEKLEELREKQGGTLTPQQMKMENDLRMQLAQAQQEQAMQQMQMQMQMGGYDMTQLDAHQQQQMMMMHGVDPMMMYGMEEEEEEGEAGEDGWLAPDSAFLNQQMGYGGGAEGGQPWMQGFTGFEGEVEDDDGYGDDFEDAPYEQSPKKGNGGGAAILEIPPFNPSSGGKKAQQNQQPVHREGKMGSPTASAGEGPLNSSFEDEISDASIEIGASDEEEEEDAGF